MQEIDITEKLDEFYRHLYEPDVDRTIFSAKFGDGKTVFLQKFKERYEDVFDFYTLYPVNYQIAPNEAVMEYIKRDLLFQLILNGNITPDIEIPDSILFQWYVNNKSGGILQDVISFAPSVVGTDTAFSKVLTVALALKETIKSQFRKFADYKEKIESKDDYNKTVQVIERLSSGKGNIYELDPITYLIASAIKKSPRPSVLIIEDLDRIDPAHLFRILNVFSAHIDRQYLCSTYTLDNLGEEVHLDELPNKFGFNKVVFVMDAGGTKELFRHFYGDCNYRGYISKFLSTRVFYYSILDYAHQQLMHHINVTCDFDIGEIINAKETLGVDIEHLSVRDIAKVINGFETSYQTVKVEVSPNFCFMSDTPIVRLLATLLRLGVKEECLFKFFEGISSSRLLIKTLGGFAMNAQTIGQSCTVYYGGKLYHFHFEEKDGFKVQHEVIESGRVGNTKNYKFIEVKLNAILAKALKYVN